MEQCIRNRSGIKSHKPALTIAIIVVISEKQSTEILPTSPQSHSGAVGAPGLKSRFMTSKLSAPPQTNVLLGSFLGQPFLFPFVFFKEL